jgi:hypothetical protein
VLQLLAGHKYGRRELLSIGTLGLCGLALPDLLRAQSTTSGVLKNKSVVFLNFQGGPTQFELFDPKPNAPAEIRSIFGATPTTIPGVQFGSQLPLLAKQAHRMAIVRSYRHGISSHGPAAYHVMAGGNPTGAMMGALYARAAGLSNPETGMPRNALITAAGVGEDFKGIYASVDRVSQVGTLPSAYKPFNLGGGSTLIDNMKLQLEPERLGDRQGLLGALDKLKRQVDTARELQGQDRFQEQAFNVLTRGVSMAFDLSREDPAVLAAYDTGEMAPTAGAKARNSYAQQFSPIALGRQLLMARRMIEAGCGFVTVTCGGWDMHGGGKEFTMRDGLNTLTPAVDKAVSAFIEDIDQRGMSDDVLLVMTGEFGRTPRINKNGGRDHWGNLCPLVFVGGGLKMGQVIGQSDPHGGEPISDRVSSQQVLATIMNTLFDTGKLRLQQGIPREIEETMTGGDPISQLFS